MSDNPNAAALRAKTLARFPLSRVTEAFHDDMLGVLPPGHISGMHGGGMLYGIFQVGEFTCQAGVEISHVHRQQREHG